MADIHRKVCSMTRKGRGLQKAGDLLQDIGQFSIAPRETAPAIAAPTPLTPEFENAQLNLFQNFLCNTDEERERFSNAIDLWDSVPRYSVNRQTMTKVRANGKFLDNYQLTFQYRGRTYTSTISPARVTDLDGKVRDFYPSATEELVEDALRKLAIEQQAGFFDRPNYRSGVVFSIYSLREELSKRGHARSYQEIRLALDILSGSIIEIASQDNESGEILVKAPYLPSVTAATRSRLRNDPQAKWAVQFHPLVTGSIDKVTYRQFNYHVMMSHSSQLARWLHKQLALKYTFADLTKPFEVRYSTVKRDSGLLTGYSRERDALEALEYAFKELHQRDLISSYERKDQTGPRRKILDSVFRLWPSVEFIREAKAANKRLQVAHQTPAVDGRFRSRVEAELR
jgi:hypothetical protein